VGEVVKGRVEKTPCIQRSHINFTTDHLILSIRTEKVKTWRKVPTSRALEDWLHEPIRNYLDIVQEDNIFPISTRWAEKVFEKWFGTQRIHLLRHWACTHALQGKRTKNKLGIQDIARLGGWIDLKTPHRIYSHVVVEDLLDDI